MAPPGPVGPRHGDLDFLLKGGAAHLVREPPNRGGRYPATLRYHLGGVARIEIPLGHELEDGYRSPTIRQCCISDEAGGYSCCHSAGERSRRL